MNYNIFYIFHINNFKPSDPIKFTYVIESKLAESINGKSLGNICK